MMNVIYLGGLFVLSKPYGNDTSYRLRIASLILRQPVIRYGRDPTSTCLLFQFLLIWVWNMHLYFYLFTLLVC